MFRLSVVNKIQRNANAFKMAVPKVRTIKMDVEHFFPPEMVPPTMARFRSEMQEISKGTLHKFEVRGRRNNETLESLWADVEDSFKTTDPYRLNEEQIQFISEYFGYQREEIEIAQDLEKYKNVMFTEEGSFDYVPNWEKWREHIGAGSSSMIESINTMQDQWTTYLKRYQGRVDQSELDRVRKELKNFDFSKFEGKIPKSTLDQIKKNYEMVIEKYTPDLDSNEMNRLIHVEMKRAYEEVCDELGVMKKAYLTIPTEKIAHYGPMFLTDEEGNLVWDYQSLAFIDRFFPEVRDLVLKEMAVENWRMEFPVESKKYAITYDELVQRIHKFTLDSRRRETDIKIAVATGSNKRQVELARQLQNVSELLEEASQLSREANASKAEGKDEKKQSAGTTGETEKSTSAEEDELVWTAIEEQTGQTRLEMFGGRSGNYEPIDINAMLDEEEKAGKK